MHTRFSTTYKPPTSRILVATILTTILMVMALPCLTTLMDYLLLLILAMAVLTLIMAMVILTIATPILVVVMALIMIVMGPMPTLMAAMTMVPRMRLTAMVMIRHPLPVVVLLHMMAATM